MARHMGSVVTYASINTDLAYARARPLSRRNLLFRWKNCAVSAKGRAQVGVRELEQLRLRFQSTEDVCGCAGATDL